MREIKFRGWHTTSKIMFSAEEMATDQLTLLPTGSFINVSGNSTRLSIIYPQDKFIPLQYTGLKDKNGKEIYEGDIFRITVPPCESNQVIFDDGEYKLVDHGLSLSEYIQHGKVIGNIYENPELLEGLDK